MTYRCKKKREADVTDGRGSTSDVMLDQCSFSTLFGYNDRKNKFCILHYCDKHS